MMSTLIAILLPIVLIDMINPILFAGVIYGLGSKHPFVNGTAILVSFFITYLLSGILIAMGLDLVMEAYHLPPVYDYVLELIVAGLLFIFAWKIYHAPDAHPEESLIHTKTMTLSESLFVGVQINLIGLPFAIPYFAAIDQMLKAEVHAIELFCLLLLYNILYILPFSILIVIRWMYKKESHRIFQTANQWMHSLSVKYLPFIFLILGLILLEDFISFLLDYRVYSLLRI
ncbi:MAG: GAP family protein [Waddliaceae bacterium]